MNLDALFSRKYDHKHYTCANFVCECYNLLTGGNIEKGLLPPMDVKGCFARIQKPEEFCVISMRDTSNQPHVGLFFKGRVLHMSEDKGVQYVKLDVVERDYKLIRFYKCRTK